jgi:integrase
VFKITSRAPPRGEAWGTSHQLRPNGTNVPARRHQPLSQFSHALRHTWASLATMNGTPLLLVAKKLGHVDIRMLEKPHGHLAPSYVAEAIRAGAPKFGFTPTSVVPLRG